MNNNMEEFFTHLDSKIKNNEVFTESLCLTHEDAILDFLRSVLLSYSYGYTDVDRKVWKQAGTDKEVVLCLVDDIQSCSKHYYAVPPGYAFGKTTLAVTDNLISVPTQFELLRLPESFFGIYSYFPKKARDFNPQKHYNFVVNRIDTTRLMTLFEFVNSVGSVEEFLNLSWANFNCTGLCRTEFTSDKRQDLFVKYYEKLHPEAQKHYQSEFQSLTPLMPIKNHSMTMEQVHVSAWLNVVIETYANPSVIALSEKIFRALVTPAPWTVLGSPYTVMYLRKLGFDVLDDLVDHGYDSIHSGWLSGKNDKVGDAKINSFVYASKKSVEMLRKKRIEDVAARCNEAAMHNSQMLLELRQRWFTDFAKWLPSFIKLIA